MRKKSITTAGILAIALGTTGCFNGGSSSNGGDEIDLDIVRAQEVYDGEVELQDTADLTDGDDAALAMDFAYFAYLLETAIDSFEEVTQQNRSNGSETVEGDCVGQPNGSVEVEDEASFGDDGTKEVTSTWTTDEDDGYCVEMLSQRDVAVRFHGEVTQVTETDSQHEKRVGVTTYEDFEMEWAQPEPSDDDPLQVIIDGEDHRGNVHVGSEPGEDGVESYIAIALDVRLPDLGGGDEVHAILRNLHIGTDVDSVIDMELASPFMDGAVTTDQAGKQQFFDGTCDSGPLAPGQDADRGLVTMMAGDSEYEADLADASPGCGEFSLYDSGSGQLIGVDYDLLSQLLDQ
ncbi:hypothetical protein [Aquisalimonas asiatica]|uniref:Uncharacterized protein n=1 Tax=Aquisalimonas asiatica TaxID=406100 RepID=A0A1H8S5J0_9GAMM|nr:hypothetical protein [Aquisalimonas asiatica]SEO73895.1 hypothetical protein SAMN04488052_102511 [Aquisalimonas asiatica]